MYEKFQERTIILEYCPTSADALTKAPGETKDIRYTTNLLVERISKLPDCHNSQSSTLRP
jgi:phage host-nuclease inhibitor protein Gam